MREAGADDVVMEVSSHALAQHRVDGAVFDVALFTNLSQDHLDFHETMEDYFAAKARLFTPEHSPAGVVCVDDEWGAPLAREGTVPVRHASARTLGRGAELRSARHRDWRASSRLTDRPAGQLRAPVPPAGRLQRRQHRARRGVPAASSATRSHRVAAALAEPVVPGRMEVVTGRSRRTAPAASSTTRIPPTPSTPPSAPSGRRRPDGWSSSSVPAATATAEAAGMGAAARPGPTPSS